MRRLVRNIVTPLAGEIRECANWREAIATYKQERPDLVLMDTRMAEVDGIEATRQIKSSDADAQIIIATDYDDDELRQAAMQAGTAGYARKENLLDLVRLLEEIPHAYRARHARLQCQRDLLSWPG